MYIGRAATIGILVGIGVALMGVPASAQQPTAASTPIAPNPNWCPGAPASPPPQILEPDVWNREWQRCMNLPGVAEDYTCGHLCRGALEMQWRARNASPTAGQSPEWPAPTDKQQGPFRLKGGGFAPNPNWCPGVSESPTPPGFPEKQWAREWRLCMNLPYPATEFICRQDCRGAVEMWSRSRQPGYGQNQSTQYPVSTDKVQGPFRPKGGGWLIIGPRAQVAQTPNP
jgi:hypothetical protein